MFCLLPCSSRTADAWKIPTPLSHAISSVLAVIPLIRPFSPSRCPLAVVLVSAPESRTVPKFKLNVHFRFVLYRVYHLKSNPKPIYTLRYKYEIRSRSIPCNGPSQPPPWHSDQGNPCFQGTAHASCAKVMQIRKRSIHEQNVCSFSNIDSRQNRLLLFRKQLAIRILTRNYRYDKNTPTCKKISGWSYQF
jgi:hypothetical protein